jgi:hypothetical protein
MLQRRNWIIIRVIKEHRPAAILDRVREARASRETEAMVVNTPT